MTFRLAGGLSLACCLAQLTLMPRSANAFVVAAVESVNFNGWNPKTDSFDSSNTNLFPGGIYNPTNAFDHGDIVILSTTNDAVHLTNAKVKGSVRTPPGGVQGTTVTAGPQGSVGDNAWVNGGNTGFEAGHFRTDVNFTFDPVVLPNVIWLTPTSGTVNGTNYTYVLNSSSPNYRINGNLSGGQNIYVNSPNSILYITGNVTINSGQVIIAPAASLAIYVGGATAQISGNGIANGSGVAKNFIYYGLASNTSLTITANSTFAGGIYAPSADFQLGSGDNNSYDFMGQSVTKSFTANGHLNLHFDESGAGALLYPARIVGQPQNQSVLVGQTAAFAVSASGTQPLRFKWYFNGTSALATGTKASLTLTNVQLADAGSYLVTVSNTYGFATSAPATLSVYETAEASLTSVTVTPSNQFQFEIAGVPGFNYVVQTSTNLTDWDPLTTNVSPFNFSEAISVDLSQRFYRAVYLP